MRARLETLGVEGVRARTFHSAALAQLRALWPGRAGRDPSVESHGASPDRQHAAQALQVPAGGRPRDRDRVGQEPPHRVGGLRSLRSADHEPPIPVDLMKSVYKRYENGKHDRNLIDFEDLLELTIQMFQTTSGRASASRPATTRSPSTSTRTSTCCRRRCCGNGSASATTSAWSATTTSRSTGSPGRRPRYLLEMPTRFPRTDGGPARVELPLDARRCSRSRTSSCPSSGGAEKVLRAVRDSGPEPALRAFSSPSARDRRSSSNRIKELHDGRRRARGDGDPLPGELPLGGLRGGARGRRDPVPGQGRRLPGPSDRSPASSPRCASPRQVDVAAAVRKAADELGYHRRACPTISATRSSLARTTSPASYASPRSSTTAAHDRGRLRRRHRGSLRERLRRGPRREPADAPSRQGPRVRGRVPPSARGRRTSVQAFPHARERSPRNGACSTSGSREPRRISRSRGSPKASTE